LAGIVVRPYNGPAIFDRFDNKLLSTYVFQPTEILTRPCHAIDALVNIAFGFIMERARRAITKRPILKSACDIGTSRNRGGDDMATDGDGAADRGRSTLTISYEMSNAVV
jgi:hypothetical protein